MRMPLESALTDLWLAQGSKQRAATGRKFSEDHVRDYGSHVAGAGSGTRPCPDHLAVDRLPRKMPAVTLKLIRTSKDAKEMLRFDLENENDTIRNYRDRVRPC